MPIHLEDGRLHGTFCGFAHEPVDELAGDLMCLLHVVAEALSRFPGAALEPPDAWFADARAIGLGVDLELVAVRRALETVDVLAADAFLSVNVGTTALAADGFADLIGAIDPRRLVIELTESEPDGDALSAGSRLALREAGIRLAVDDLGAGFAALHFCRATGATLVAEGVDRPEDLATLVEIGVPLAQGYLLGRPATPGASGT